MNGTPPFLRESPVQGTALSVNSTDDTLSVELSDGRSIAAPLAWYPRLLHATKDERDNWRLIAGGQGVHWPELDEDISVENLLAGKASGESNLGILVEAGHGVDGADLPPTSLADSGVENRTKGIDELVDSGVLRRVLAQTETRRSRGPRSGERSLPRPRWRTRTPIGLSNDPIGDPECQRFKRPTVRSVPCAVMKQRTIHHPRQGAELSQVSVSVVGSTPHSPHGSGGTGPPMKSPRSR